MSQIIYNFRDMKMKLRDQMQIPYFYTKWREMKMKLRPNADTSKLRAKFRVLESRYMGSAHNENEIQQYEPPTQSSAPRFARVTRLTLPHRGIFLKRKGDILWDSFFLKQK